MKLSEFDYHLPEELIAQYPTERRDQSRLLVLDRESSAITHKTFTDLLDYLAPGDLLVMNNSKVFPARLYGEKEITHGKVELLLQKQIKDNVWETIGKGLRVGARIKFEGSTLEASVLQKNNDVYEIFFNLNGDNFFQELEKIGKVPLPPYIKRDKADISGEKADQERYQTVYAKERGSVAAPTAGLHFTDALLNKITRKGVSIEELTLHVGLGTFAPVKTLDITEHKMHKEYYSITKKTIHKIQDTKQRGGRIIAVGTTSARVLETIFRDSHTLGQLFAKNSEDHLAGSTDIFIYPPYDFQCIDGLITNFHLPKSTLLMLISAFAGSDNIKTAYAEAIKNEYRFFSYGDAMLII